MHVNAINSNLNFEGLFSKKNKKVENKTQTNPMPARREEAGKNVSNNSFSNATKAMALAVLMTPVAGSMMTGCTDKIDIDMTDIHNVYNPKDTLYIPVWQKPDTVYLDKIVKDTVLIPQKPDTVYIPKTDTLYINKTDTIVLPGTTDTIFVPKTDTVFIPKTDTIFIPKNDTIFKTDTIMYPVIIPGDTVFIPKKYSSEVFDIMKEMMKEVGIDTEGQGDLITRMIAKDEWNEGSLNVYDLKGKKSSEQKPAYDRTTYGWDDNEEQIVIGKNMTYGELDVSKSQNGGLYLEHKVPRGNASIKPSTADGYRLDKETTLTKGNGMLYRKDITNGEVDKGTIRRGDKPQSVFFHEPLGEFPENELIWRWSDIVVKLGEKPEDAE